MGRSARPEIQWSVYSRNVELSSLQLYAFAVSSQCVSLLAGSKSPIQSRFRAVDLFSSYHNLEDTLMLLVHLYQERINRHYQKYWQPRVISRSTLRAQIWHINTAEQVQCLKKYQIVSDSRSALQGRYSRMIILWDLHVINRKSLTPQFCLYVFTKTS